MIDGRHGTGPLQIRGDLERRYPDVLTPDALAALVALARFDAQRVALMAARLERRARRARDRQGIGFLDPDQAIPGTDIGVRDAREGRFIGSEIPADLRRQWIQGTGPGSPAERVRRCKASATSPTPCSPAPTAGCSTARTRSARSPRCRWTTSAT